jgi:hypothetical protein
MFVLFVSYIINRSTDCWGAMLQGGKSRLRLPMQPLIFFSEPNFSSFTMPPWFTQRVTEMGTGRFLGIEPGRCVRLTS